MFYFRRSHKDPTRRIKLWLNVLAVLSLAILFSLAIQERDNYLLFLAGGLVLAVVIRQLGLAIWIFSVSRRRYGLSKKAALQEALDGLDWEVGGADYIGKREADLRERTTSKKTEK